MEYFNIKRSLFIVPSEKCYVEFKKIDKFMVLLEKSDVGKKQPHAKFCQHFFAICWHYFFQSTLCQQSHLFSFQKQFQ